MLEVTVQARVGDGADRAMPEVTGLDALTELAVHRRDLFLRYSHGPDRDLADGPSMDYESGLRLPGLSVTTITPEPWWSRPAADWVARRLCKYADLGDEAGRRPWLLTGAVAGWGPDHEPVLAMESIHPVAWITPGVIDEAQRRYRARFQVDQDSTSG